ncbi:LTA synthase family protein [Marinicrinis lubricantis]|uniref:LTA synthase family protein n=1 Tax=Marinicrinis lubricantis TaxID=2086470 RepID=A0ABW1IVT5_9BACL
MKWIKKWTVDNWSRLWLFYLAIGMIWLKTYLVQRFQFNLPVESPYQELILFITPVSSTMLLLGIGLLFFKKRSNFSVILISFLTSAILLADLIYYRFYNDFITLPVLFQAKNVGDLGSSVSTLFSFTDLLVFLDTVVLILLTYVKKVPQVRIQRPELVSVFAFAIIVFFVNWSMAESVRPELLTRTFDRNIVVKSIGNINYHIYDIVQSSKMSSKKVFADSSDLMDAEKYLQQSPKDIPSDELYGIAKDKNVFLISMESLQGFVINRKMFGQEITPFLNDLIEDSYYFENFYHQTGQGKTSDAEFMMDNSLYPLPSGAVYFTHANNTYTATPSILKDQGYYSAVFHANDASFWNRELMYDTLGYDNYFAKEYYNITPENSVGWGLKDIDFFKQTVQLAKDLPQPFYAKLLTLTNHHPYEYSKEDQMIPEFNSGDGSFDRYFVTVRYLDEALKNFFDEVKKNGLYENSIFIMYGDHYGISENHNRAMGEFLNKEEITPYDSVQLQKVPLIIHIPGQEGKTLDTISGQIDVKPTLLHLLGVDDSQAGVNFGHDLFAENKPQLTVLRNGSFITDEYVFAQETCYERETGVEVDSANCEPFQDKAANDLQYSDEIIYGDLLRFILPENEQEDADKAAE